MPKLATAKAMATVLLPDDFDEDDPLHGLVERTKTDPGAPFEMEVLVALKHVAAGCT